MHMSRKKAFGFTILCAVMAVLFILWHVGTCVVGSLLLGGIFGVVYFRKVKRDQGFIEQANAHAAQLAKQLPGPPDMTSEDSIGLFIPPPLPERSK